MLTAVKINTAQAVSEIEEIRRLVKAGRADFKSRYSQLAQCFPKSSGGYAVSLKQRLAEEQKIVDDMMLMLERYCSALKKSVEGMKEGDEKIGQIIRDISSSQPGSFF